MCDILSRKMGVGTIVPTFWLVEKAPWDANKCSNCSHTRIFYIHKRVFLFVCCLFVCLFYFVWFFFQYARISDSKLLSKFHALTPPSLIFRGVFVIFRLKLSHTLWRSFDQKWPSRARKTHFRNTLILPKMAQTVPPTFFIQTQILNRRLRDGA